MKVGVGLPSMLHGVGPDVVLEWARAADRSPLSTLCTGELVTTPSYDALTVLTAAGAVTSRIRLMTNVLVLPLHREGMLAKQAATICLLTGGRLTLGLGIGGKKPILFDITDDQTAHSNYPDFDAAPAPYARRAERYVEQIATMRRLWAGEPPAPGVPPVGPAPARAGGPELLVGGFDERAIARCAVLAEGLTIFDHRADEAKVQASFGLARSAWRSAGRPGAPRLVASTYFALGPHAAEGKVRFLDTHYGHLSGDGRARIGAAIVTDDERRVRDALDRFASIGADETLLIPMMPDLDQVTRLAGLL